MPRARLIVAGLVLTAWAAYACTPGSGSFSDLAQGVEDASVGHEGGSGDSGADGGGGQDGTGPQDSGGGTPDGGQGGCVTTPPSNACGLSPQCGCGPHQTCDLADQLGNVRCVSAGAAAVGHGCKTTSDCAQGLLCLARVCKPPCATVGVPCGSGYGRCLQYVDTTGKPIPNGLACQIDCDLMDPNGCGGIPTDTTAPMAACEPDLDGGADCVIGGREFQGDPCNQWDPPYCAQGYGCAGQQGSQFLCFKWCQNDFDCAFVGTLNKCDGIFPPVFVKGVRYSGCR